MAPAGQNEGALLRLPNELVQQAALPHARFSRDEHESSLPTHRLYPSLIQHAEFSFPADEGSV
jgi:hypothetical protein